MLMENTETKLPGKSSSALTLISFRRSESKLVCNLIEVIFGLSMFISSYFIRYIYCGKNCFLSLPCYAQKCDFSGM